MNILAIGCHPDDLVIQCSGTLRKYVERGDKVFMVDIANGNLGHKVIEKDELRVIRRKESEVAARVIGAEYFAVDIGDCLVNNHDEDAQDRLIDIVRYTKPDAVITHNPSDYMRDHEEAGYMAFSASFTAGCNHRYTEYPAIDNVPAIMYMDTADGLGFIPTEYVDITDVMDKKIEAIMCHKSQIEWLMEHDHADVIDQVRICAKYRGYQCGVKYAEGFRPCIQSLRMRPYRILP